MKIYKQLEDMSVIDITKSYNRRKKIVWFYGLMLSIFLFCSFSTINPTNKITITVHDTIKQLIVLKHGLTEVTVDRNANIPTFCNNPGALRSSSIKEVNDLAIGIIQSSSGEFLHFANAEHGYKALEIVLRKVYWNKTISECISRYAPSFENDTDGYVNKIVKKLGINTNTKVKNCDIKKLMKIIAEIEGFKK